MPNVFFPYRYYDEVLSIEIKNLEVDNKAKQNYVDNEKKCIGLEIVKNWEFLECNIVVKIPDELPEKISLYDSNDDWKAILIIKSMAGSGRQIGWRKKIKLMPSDGTKLFWEGKLKLSMKDEGSWVQIQAFLTRAKDLEPLDNNLALHLGQRLASSKLWSINIDERSSPLGKSIRVEWINFKEDSRFEDFPMNMYYIDFSEAIPILYLNEAIDDLKVVLNSKGYHGLRAAVRESIYRSIAQPVWLSLILTAIEDDYDDEDDRPEWQRSVITQFAPLVITDASDKDDAIQLFLKLGKSPDIFLPKIVSAIQSSLEIDRTTSRLLSSIV